MDRFKPTSYSCAALEYCEGRFVLASEQTCTSEIPGLHLAGAIFFCCDERKGEVVLWLNISVSTVPADA